MNHPIPTTETESLAERMEDAVATGDATAYRLLHTQVRDLFTTTGIDILADDTRVGRLVAAVPAAGRKALFDLLGAEKARVVKNAHRSYCRGD